MSKRWATRDKDQDKVFFDLLRNTGNIRAACRASGYEYMQVYYYKRISPMFERQWNEALNHAWSSGYSHNRRRSAYGPMPSKPGEVDEIIRRVSIGPTKGRAPRDLGR